MVTPSDDNVIYANFGRKVRVEKPEQTRDERVQRRPAMAPAAELLIEVATSRADRGRLTRGRDYARAGHVLSMDLRNGAVHAEVAGSQNEPFAVTVQLPYRNADDLARVSSELARTRDGMQGARRGELSRSVVGVLLAEDINDIRVRCDCPDPHPLCKHAVAVLEKLAAKIDADPLALFGLRGMDLLSLEKAVMVQAKDLSREAEEDPALFWSGRALPSLPEPRVAPALDDSDLDLLHKAMRAVSYTNVDQLRAVSDIEDMYDHLCRGGMLDNES
ncbi:SWIM zinc finger family protein [Corynebacterium nasicanis]|uniref:SWIM zinc finger family protein n=1 Tax=Corynebacterium nasicanis TaxID=1448267 RepID=A0ABW1QAL8_9CORY